MARRIACATCGREFTRVGPQRYCAPGCRPSTPAKSGRPPGRPKGSRRPQERGIARRRRLRELLDAGLGYRQAAAELGVSVQRVYQMGKECSPGDSARGEDDPSSLAAGAV